MKIMDPKLIVYFSLNESKKCEDFPSGNIVTKLRKPLQSVMVFMLSMVSELVATHFPANTANYP